MTEARSVFLALVTAAVALLPLSVNAHQDAIFQVSPSGEVAGIASEYAPVAFQMDRSSDAAIVRIGERQTEFPPCTQPVFAVPDASMIRFVGSWWHDFSIIPPYIRLELPAERVTPPELFAGYAILFNLKTGAFMELNRHTLSSDGATSTMKQVPWSEFCSDNEARRIEAGVRAPAAQPAAGADRHEAISSEKRRARQPLIRQTLGAGMDLRVTIDELDEPNPEALAWAVIEPSWEKVDIYQGLQEFERSLIPLTPGQRAVISIHWLSSEVRNGGFAQFFTNSTGVVYAEALRGLALVGAQSVESVVRRASDVFPSGRVPAEREAREAVFDSLPPSSDATIELLDDAFLEELPALYSAIAAYIRANPSEFARPAA